MTDVKRVRRKNPIGAQPPAIVSVQEATSYSVMQRKVTKNGVSLNLRQGSRVNVLQVDAQTYIVSERPKDEVEKLAATLPVQKPSPFAALSEKLRGQPHAIDATRVRHAFTGVVEVPPIGDEAALATANLRRTQRSR